MKETIAKKILSEFNQREQETFTLIYSKREFSLIPGIGLLIRITATS